MSTTKAVVFLVFGVIAIFVLYIVWVLDGPGIYENERDMMERRAQEVFHRWPLINESHRYDQVDGVIDEYPRVSLLHSEYEGRLYGSNLPRRFLDRINTDGIYGYRKYDSLTVYFTKDKTVHSVVSTGSKRLPLRDRHRLLVTFYPRKD